MTPAPQVIVFDVNETLSDMAPLADRFVDVGATAELAKLWFASVLRDGFARTAAEAPVRFAEVADGALRVVFAGLDLDRPLDEAVGHVMDGFSALQPHPDVAPGVGALSALGIRLVTLSNGSAQVAEGLLGRAGLRDRFEALLSVEDAAGWKPCPASYAHAVAACGTAPSDMMLVAVHPWDIDGAARAGLRTAWISRDNGPYPSHCTAPELVVDSLPELAARLG